MDYSVFGLFLPFVTLVFSLSSLVIISDCVWRTENKFAPAFKFLAISLTISTARRIVGILGLDEAVNWSNTFVIFDLLGTMFFVLGAIEFARIIRRDTEKKA